MPGRVYYMYASTAQEMSDWVQVLQAEAVGGVTSPVTWLLLAHIVPPAAPLRPTPTPQPAPASRATCGAPSRACRQRQRQTGPRNVISKVNFHSAFSPTIPNAMPAHARSPTLQFGPSRYQNIVHFLKTDIQRFAQLLRGGDTAGIERRDAGHDITRPHVVAHTIAIGNGRPKHTHAAMETQVRPWRWPAGVPYGAQCHLRTTYPCISIWTALVERTNVPAFSTAGNLRNSGGRSPSCKRLGGGPVGESPSGTKRAKRASASTKQALRGDGKSGVEYLVGHPF